MINGVPRMNMLSVAEVHIDASKGQMVVSSTAALIDRATGVTAWYKATGNIWSAETRERLSAFLSSIEHDLAGALLIPDTVIEDPAQPEQATKAAGLGEYLSSKGIEGT